MKARKQLNVPTEPFTPMESTSTLQTSDFEINIQPLTSENKETKSTDSINPDVDERENHQMKGTVTHLSDRTTNIPPTYDASSASHSTTTIADPDPEFDQVEDNREIQIINLEAEANIPSIHKSCLQTLLAAAFANVIGHDDAIMQFDQLRHRTKEAKKDKRQLPGYKKLTEQHVKSFRNSCTEAQGGASAEHLEIRTRFFLIHMDAYQQQKRIHNMQTSSKEYSKESIEIML